MPNNEMMIVNFVEMRAGSDAIEKALAALARQLHELEAAARPLVSDWTGSAQQAYAQRQRQWRQASADLTLMLRDIKRALDDSAVGYHDAEVSNARRFE
jgi:WXG100 family type VII secretion target